MGYDMYVCTEDGDALETNYEDNNYLRRSIGTQGPLREALAQVGMAFYAAGYDDSAPWPKAPDLPNGEKDWENPEYQAAVAHRLKHSFDERPGIPLHKLCMNEGWWVTQVECRSALQLWERAGCPTPDDFHDDVIPFLQNAASHGGFRVY